MPALPTVLARSAGNVVAVPNVQVTTGAIAGGLASAAQSVGELDAKIQQANEREGRIWATRRNAELRAGLIKAGTERELSGEPLDGFGNWYETAAKEAYAAALDDAPNNFGRMYLDDYSVSAVSAFGETGLRKEADYRVTRNLTELDGTLESLKSLAFLDPGNAETYAAQWRDALDGTPLPYDKAAALKDSEQAIFGSAIGSLIENDPYAARGRIDGWVKSGYLNAEQGLTFQNRAEAGIKSREAEAKQRANEAKAAQAEAARIALEGADDALAFVAAGNNPTPEILNNYSPERIYALTGSEKAAKKAADAFARGEGVRELLNAGTPAERAKVIEDWRAKAADPENYQFNQDTLRILESGAADLNEKLVKDPGGVAQMSTRVQDAIKTGSGVNIVAASYAEQERQGIPDFQRKPLSNAYAAQVAEQIASLPPDQQAGALQEMAQSFGSYWPDVLKQIGDKLPGPLAVAAVMPPGRGATRVAETAGLKVDELTAGLEKDAKDGVEKAMADNERLVSLGRVLSSQTGGASTLAQYNDAVMRSALVLMREGKDATKAVEQAALDVTADTAFVESGASVVAVPADQNTDMISAGLDAVKGGIDLSAVDLPPSATGYTPDEIKSAYATAIRQNGEWVASGDGRGVYLRVLGDLVTRGGEPILFTWEDLKSAALPQGGYMFEQGR